MHPADVRSLEPITVWGVGTPRTLRVHWALQELGCRYRTHPITPRSEAARHADYVALNPAGKLPTLVDGGYVLTESGAIVGYLLRRYGAAGDLLPPTEPRALGRYEEWVSLALMELDAAAMYVMRRHLDLADLHGAAPVAVEAAAAHAERVLDGAAARLGAGPYLLGSRFSGADILFSTSVANLLMRGVDLPPPIAAYLRRTTARPAYRLAIEVNGSSSGH